jgi:2-phosphosulfolactate phosphatase
MRLHVAFHPTLLATGSQPAVSPTRPQVCVVVDVIRASTTLVTLVERGASRIYIASGIAAARAGAGRVTGAVMAGEQDAVAPPGFDYVNSPVEASRARVEGRPVIFATTNGTAANQAVHRLGPVLIGALRNARAVAAEAVAAAGESGCDLTIVCAGREGSFGLDDAYCAGALVERILPIVKAELTDAADGALRLRRSAADALELFRQTAAGQNVIRRGLGPDVDFCAEVDVSPAVPRLGRELEMLDDGRADG